MLELEGTSPAVSAKLADLERLELVLEGSSLEEAVTSLVALSGVAGQGFIATVVLPEKLPSTVRVGQQGLWSPRQELDLRPDGSGAVEVQAKLQVWEATTVTGKLQIDPDQARPNGVKAIVSESQLLADRKIERRVQDCLLEKDGEGWRCALPRALLNLAIKAPGYAAVHYLALDLRGKTILDVGSVKLIPGASVSGFVEAGPAFMDVLTSCSVIGKAVAGGVDRDVVERQSLSDARASVSDDGFYQLSGLSAGPLAIEAECDGVVAARLGPLILHEGSESFLSAPLILRSPVELEVTVVPASAPTGREWRIELARQIPETGTWGEPRNVTLDAGGAVVPGLLPGRYFVSVMDQAGATYYSGEVETAASHLAVDLELREVHGEVSLGDEPLESAVWFGGRRGIRVDTDEDGEFDVVLPERESWIVTVAGLIETDIEHTFRNTTIPKWGSVKLSIPDTRIEGTVKLMTSGEPVPDAEVVVISARTNTSSAMSSDEDGSFSLRGLPAGPVVASASKTIVGISHESDHQMIVLTEDGAARVDLLLEERVSVRGRVVWRGGEGAVGARVLALNGMSVAEGLTEVDGTFELKIGGRAPTSTFVVTPPGGALKAATVETTAQEEPTFVVSREGGTLVLEGVGEDWHLAGAVLQDGTPIPGSILVSWADARGASNVGSSSVRVPGLEPGQYAACRFVLGPGGQIFVEGCSQPQYLSSGDEIHIKVSD